MGGFQSHRLPFIEFRRAISAAKLKGVRVKELASNKYRFRRDGSTCVLQGMTMKTEMWFYLTVGSNPIFWMADGKLLKDIQRIMKIHGAVTVTQQDFEAITPVMPKRRSSR